MLSSSLITFPFRQQHAYHDGRVEEVVVRNVEADDGDTAIAKDIR